MTYGMRMPVDVYPLFENALRARRGLDLKTHRRHMGELFSPFSEIAAKNPYAWFPTARSAEELTTVTPSNRMVGFPYPKYLNAVLDTDQAAGVWLTSAEYARQLGIPEERWVYWRGGAVDQEVARYASQRPDFARCPALRRSVGAALKQAGIEISELVRSRRVTCHQCLDWSVRRHHIAGALGAAILTKVYTRKWARKDLNPRALRFTRSGKQKFERVLRLAPFA